MSRETTLAKIAAMAQFLDNAGLHEDATVMDGVLEAFASGEMVKEAGFWQAVLSRLGGWARKLLFKEYREMYASAKGIQAAIDQRLDRIEAVNKRHKDMLARHQLVDWRQNVAALLPAITMPVDETLAAYDDQLSQLTRRLLKISPKGGEPKTAPPSSPVMPPILPEEEGGGPAPAGPAGTPEEPIPLTTVKRRPEATPPTGEGPAEAVPERTLEETPEPATTTPEAAPAAPAPLPGWKKERFGTSGKHGWEWEWEVSPDGNRLRLPRNQLAAASSGKGKILHRQDGRYRPTGGTSSVKLRRLMGNVFWEEEDDSSDPNMAILTRTEDTVPFPLSMRQEPAEQARRLKNLGKSSAERLARIMAVAADELDEPTDEERLDAAAEALLDNFEEEPDTEEG